MEEAHTRELVARLDIKQLPQSYLVKRHVLQDEQSFWVQMVAERIGAKLENTSNITEMREGLLALRNAAVRVWVVCVCVYVCLFVCYCWFDLLCVVCVCVCVCVCFVVCFVNIFFLHPRRCWCCLWSTRCGSC